MELTVEQVKKFRATRLPGYGAIEVPKTVACIDFLLAEIKRIEKQTAVEWISVDDRLPEYGYCLAVYKDKLPFVAMYQKVFDSNIFTHCCIQVAVTHWQPLPPPPE